jgi:excisionase family DNA binding protein
MDGQEKAIFTLNEFAIWAGISRAQIYILIANGRLQAVKAGRRNYITRTAANDYLASLEPVMPREKAG